MKTFDRKASGVSPTCDKLLKLKVHVLLKDGTAVSSVRSPVLGGVNINLENNARRDPSARATVVEATTPIIIPESKSSSYDLANPLQEAIRLRNSRYPQ